MKTKSVYRKAKTRVRITNRILAFVLCLSMLWISSNDIVTYAAEWAAASIEEKKAAGIETVASVSADDTNWNATSARPFLYYKLSGVFGGGVPYKNEIHVYAFAGDTICLGTSVYNSGINLAGDKITNTSHKDDGSIDIVMENLEGDLVPIDIKKDGAGYIANPEEEQKAKNLQTVNGTEDYMPYQYHVTETGEYTFQFRSYDGSGGSNWDVVYKDGSTTNSADNKLPGYGDGNKQNQWLDPATQYTFWKDSKMQKKVPGNGGMVAAWDITVFDEDGEKKPGRTYADYLSLQTIGVVKEKYYVVTSDSYIYEMKFNGISPYTVSFFVNNRGIVDSANGNILYKSVKSSYNQIAFTNYGVNFTYPGIADTDVAKSFPIFFEKPSEDLKGILYEDAIAPDPAMNIHWDSGEIYEGEGGYFSFDIGEGTSATLRLDFSGIQKTDGSKYEPVEISDIVNPYSSNTFYWDGKDGEGVPIPADSYSLDELGVTVIAKAGEVHFPIVDMECAPEGITFTRINDIYSKENHTLLNTSDSIYEQTKHVIYYDDSPIYYGEMVGSTGLSEMTILDSTNASKKEDNYSFFNKSEYGKTGGTGAKAYQILKDSAGREYHNFLNVQSSTGSKGEYKAYNDYAAKEKIKVGDHSHTTNIIDYSGEAGDQSEVIKYLDSFEYPVGFATKSDAGNTTTDYGIANYWTFTPAVATKPMSTENDITIKTFKNVGGAEKKGLFNLKARVFYDQGSQTGIYRPQEDGDYLLSNVMLNLYKETEDTNTQEGKEYYFLNGSTLVKTTPESENHGDSTIYELVKSAITPLNGLYMFTGLEYDINNGTKYLYQVVKPNQSYTLTSASRIGAVTGTYARDVYKLYSYAANVKGTEIQEFIVGGTGTDNITKASLEEKDNIATVIDVGYRYVATDFSLHLKKNWAESPKKPDTVIYEISYDIGGDTEIYDMRALSAIISWSYSYEYLPEQLNGKAIMDWFVSAEYYIEGDKVFRHQYNYDSNLGQYTNFVGTDEFFSLSQYYKEHPDAQSKPSGTVYAMQNIPDLDENGISNWNDLLKIDTWETALPAGSADGESVVAPYNSVLDRDPRTAVTDITITNSTEPATIEIYKYTGTLEDGTPLKGATFRLYQGNKETVKKIIEDCDTAQTAYNSNPENDTLKDAYQKALAARDAILLDTRATRVNGKIAFSGLDSETTYTVQEKFAPSGYRVLEEFYEVDKFDENNYCLLNVANTEASGNLEVRKRITGREWLEGDSFSFNITMNEPILDANEANLYRDGGKNLDDAKNTFINQFDGEEDITISYDSDFAINAGNKRVIIDTKTVGGILENGIWVDGEKPKKEAALNGNVFPAAGTYTFTIGENDFTEEQEGKLIKSPRVFTVEIKVVRKPNDPENTSTEALDNSHLEASISKITAQDNGGEGVVSTSNNLTFTNTYSVHAETETKYAITKVFNGRKNNQWLSSDTFTISFDGYDAETKEAILGKHLIFEVEGKEIVKENGADTSKRTVTFSSDRKSVPITEIDFEDIEFPVEQITDSAGNVSSVEKPVIYKVLIQEEIPEGAVDNKYKGIQYSSDTYLLEMKLENGLEGITSSSGPDAGSETDGIPDRITYNLYKNYTESGTSEPVCTCVVEQHVEPDGTITKTLDKHGPDDDHKMTFVNTYSATAEWTPQISKTIEGREWEHNDQFNFSISGSGNPSNGFIISRDGEEAVIRGNGSSSKTVEGSFNPITFTKEGIYTFEITESSSLGVFRENNQVYTVKVKADDDDQGNMTLTYDYDGDGLYDDSEDEILGFVNDYEDTPDEYTLVLEKTLNGRIDSAWGSDDSFTFIITPDDNTKKAIDSGILVMPENLTKDMTGNNYSIVIDNSDSTVSGKTNTRSESFVMGVQKYVEDNSTYKFNIREQRGTDGGVSYTDKTYDVEVTVHRVVDENSLPTGELSLVLSVDDEVQAEIDDYGNESYLTNVTLPFTNTYHAAEISADLPELKKELTGRALKDDEFRFSLEIEPEDAGLSDGYEYSGVYEAENAADGTISFAGTDGEHASITFHKAGTYTVTVSEVIPTGAEKERSIRYCETPVTFTYVIKDDNKGKLYVDTEESEIPTGKELTFTNDYIGYSLVYDGNTGDGELTSALPIDNSIYILGDTADIDDTVMQHTQVILDDKQTNVVFIGWDYVKHDIYGAEDTPPTVIGDEVLFDEARIASANTNHEVTVYAAWGYDTNGNGIADCFEAIFVPTVTKLVDGDTPTDKTFTFTIVKSNQDKHTEDIPMPENDTMSVLVNNKAGEGSFGDLIFTEEGTYIYEISETAGSDTGYSYDDAVWILSVHVITADGKLQIDKDRTTYTRKSETARTGISGFSDPLLARLSAGAKAAAFINGYQPVAVVYKPQAEKQINGPEPGTTRRFTFVITEKTGNPEKGAALPVDTAVSVEGENTAEFGEITFTKRGTYQFTIAEQKPDPVPAGYTYDSSTWTLTVVVDDQDGKLVISGHTYTRNTAGADSRTDKAVFVNDYAVKPTTYNPQVTKKITGQTPIAAQTFTFELVAAKDYDGDVLFGGTALLEGTPLTTDITTLSESTAGFGKLAFQNAGTYEFTIREQKPDSVPAGYTYDSSAWTLTVTVEDKDSQLTVTEASYAKNVSTALSGETSNASATFENEYIPTPTEANVVIRKTIIGDVPPADNQKTFHFAITADARNPESGTAKTAWTADITGAGETSEKITFTKAGTYSFTLQETEGTDAGYIYDTTPWTYTVVIEDVGGKLQIRPGTEAYTRSGEMVPSKDDRAVFTNHYQVKETTFTPSVTKELTVEHDNPRSPETFEFYITALESNNVGASLAPGESTTVTVTLPEGDLSARDPDAGPVTLTKDGTFGGITFTKAGSYIFQIREYDRERAGFTYDGRVWTVTVTVTDEESQLTVADVLYRYQEITLPTEENGLTEPKVETVTKDKVTFENVYRANPVGYTPQVRKSFTGSRITEKETFTFEMEQNAGDSIHLSDNMAKQTVSITGDGAVNFDEILFTKPGNYHFTIREVDDGAAGYTYDGSTWTLTVEIRNVNGYLQQKHSYRRDTEINEDEAVFTNAYQVDPVSYQPTVEKTVKGNIPETYAQIFNFTLTEISGNPTGVELPDDPFCTIDMRDAEDGIRKVDGNPITFTEAGTYQFEIREVNDGNHGYSYDRTVYTLTVEVKDDDHELKVADVKYVNGADTKTEAEFTNDYYPESVVYAPAVEKIVEGESLKDETFTFTLKAAEDNPDGASLLYGEQEEVSITGSDRTWFNEITFDKIGTYHFTITETVPEGTDMIPGYTYDDSTWVLTVTTWDKGGDLDTTVTYEKTDAEADPKADAAVFTNIYTPEEITYVPKVEKQITGVRPAEAGTFTFMIAQAADNKDGGAVLPDPARISVSGEGEAEFGEIIFQKAGTYKFTISEENTEIAGYAYDNHNWTLTVVVEDKGAALEVKSHTYASDGNENTERAVFVNEYSVTAGSYQARVSKTVTGDVPYDETFTFILSADANNPEGAVLPDINQMSIIGNGSAVFDPITFTQAGTYMFRLREIDSRMPGYSYDSSEWTLTVQVTDVGGALETRGMYEKSGITDAEEATFENTYSTTEITYAPSVEKEFDPSGDIPTVDKDFIFTITPWAGNPEGAVLADAETTISGAGIGSFEPITFTKTGIYAFEIKEEHTRLPGYTYSEDVWTVLVSIKDIASVLTIDEVVYTKEDITGIISGDVAIEELEGADRASFVNRYEVQKTGYAPAIEKKVDARFDVPATDETFTFYIEALQDNPEGASLVYGESKEVTIVGSGASVFDDITFDKVGTYKFQIREQNNGTAGYTYDGQVWTVTVVVEDIDSNLTVTDVSYSNENGDTAETAVFDNVYVAFPRGYKPNVFKEFEGDELPSEQKEFIFNLELTEGVDGGVTLPEDMTASISGPGATAFETLWFTKEGTYTFQISEYEGNQAGYTYDQDIWILTVDVTNVNGFLRLEAHYAKNGEAGAANDRQAVFTNGYAVTETEYAPRVNKVVAGDTPADQEFIFTLTPDADNPAGASLTGTDTAAITGGGTTNFAPITFTRAGVYRYEIAETDGGKPGYDYDKHIWDLTVTVTDADSRLVASAEYVSADGRSSSADFVNRYQPAQASFKAQVEKVIEGEPVGTKQFFFTLDSDSDMAGVVMPESKTASLRGEGTTDFEEIVFTKRGTYTFTITERKGDASGYTYDDSIWILTVVVTDEDGVLTAKGSYQKYAEKNSGSAAESETEDIARFVNEYTMQAASYHPAAAVRIEGDTPAQAGRFTFTMEADPDNPAGADLPQKTELVMDANTGREARGTFEEVSFTKPGTYHFTVREAAGSAAGYTYDSGVWELTVVVEDRDSVLTIASVTYARTDAEENNSRAVFINTYKLKPVEYQAKVAKTVEGNPPAENEFSFYMRAKADNPEGASLSGMEEELGATINGDGESLFDAIRFTKAGTYRFEIIEETGDAIGYDYDGSIWILTVTVEDVESQLVVTDARYVKEGAESDTEAEFTNVYQAIPRAYVPHVRKDISGSETPDRKAFTFKIEENEDYGSRVVMPETLTVTQTGVGAKEFDRIIFYERGIYSFTIQEIAGEDTGYTYDDTSWTLIVEVTDNDGVLGVKPTYTNSTDTNVREAVFNNHYDVMPVEYKPEIINMLEGNPPKDAEFTFDLKAVEDYGESVILPDTLTAGITGSGSTSFDAVSFLKAGIYEFELSERNDQKAGYIYDTDIWILTVEVTDVDGVLIATTTYERLGDMIGESAEAAVFENIYRPVSVVYQPAVENRITEDRTRAYAEFTFKIEEEEGNPDGVIMPETETVIISGQGMERFEEIRFRNAGVFTFKIYEASEGEENYICDDSIWTLTVTVEDVDGTLAVMPVYTRDGTEESNNTNAIFNHIYAAPSEPSTGSMEDDTPTTGEEGTTQRPDIPSDSSGSGDGYNNGTSNTGDYMNTTVWLLLMIFSLAGMSVTGILRKKRHE